MKYALTIGFWMLVCAYCAAASGVCLDSLRTADLLFVVNDKGNAITSVTEGYAQMPIDHVAIFYTDSITQSPCVLQADYQGVHTCSLQQFIADYSSPSQSHYHLLVGRVVADFDAVQSVKNALTYVGRPYDFYFLPSDDEIYCSELVQKSYVIHAGDLLFSTIPMTFRNGAGAIADHWVQHYHKKGIPIPEGEPGSNPGDLSRRSQVRILGDLRLPDAR